MNLLPVSDATTLGAACRLRRNVLGLTLQDAAGAAGVNYRFASEFERGKPTCALGLSLKYARMLGVELFYNAEIIETHQSVEGPEAKAKP